MILLKDAATIGNASVQISISSGGIGIVICKDDIIIKDGALTVGVVDTLYLPQMQ